MFLCYTVQNKKRTEECKKVNSQKSYISHKLIKGVGTMKKKIAFIISMVIGINSAITAFAAEGVIKDGRTLVPVRGVFEGLGFSVNWDASTNKASMTDGKHAVSVIKNMNYIRADGKEIYPDVPQQVISGSFYLPLRSIADAIGAETSWNADNKMVHISYNGKDVYIHCISSEELISANTPKIDENTLLKIAKNYESTFANVAHNAIKYGSANLSGLYGGLKYPNTATFQDADNPLGVWTASQTDFSSANGKDMKKHGVTQKYECTYNGYVTSQLPTGLMKQVEYYVHIVFDLDANNKPVNIQAYYSHLLD